MDISSGFTNVPEMNVAAGDEAEVTGSMDQLLLLLLDEDGDKRIAEKDAKQFVQRMALAAKPAAGSDEGTEEPGPAASPLSRDGDEIEVHL